MSRSKRLFGVANAAPVDVSRLKAAKEFAGATTTVPTLHDLIFLENRNLHLHETPPHQSSSIRFSCYTSNLRKPSPKNCYNCPSNVILLQLETKRHRNCPPISGTLSFCVRPSVELLSCAWRLTIRSFTDGVVASIPPELSNF